MQVWKFYKYLMKTMIFIILLLCCYNFYKSLTFAVSQLASLILGDERNQVTYTTSYLPLSTLIEWIRNGHKFSDTHCETMNVVSVTNRFSVSNSSFDYVYRDKKLGKLCAYAFLNILRQSSGSYVSKKRKLSFTAI